MKIFAVLAIFLLAAPAFAVEVNVDNQVNQQQRMTGGSQSMNLTQEGGKVPRPLPGFGEVIIPQIQPFYSGDRSVSPGMVSPQILLQFGAEFTYEQLEPYSRYWGYDLYAPMQVLEKKEGEWSRKDKVRFIFAWPAEKDQAGKPKHDQFGLPVFINPPKPVGHINAYATSTNYKQMVANLAHAGMTAIKHGVPFLFVAAYGSEREIVAKMLGAMIGGGQVTINSTDDSKGYMGLGGFGAAIGSAKTPDKPWVQLIALQGEAPPLVPVVPRPEAVAPPKPAVPPKAEAAPPAEKCEAEKKELEAAKKDKELLEGMLREATDKAAKAEAEKIEIPPPLRVGILFPFKEWIPEKKEHAKAAEMAEYVKKHAEAVKKLGGEFVLVGHCDERVHKSKDHPDKDNVNPLLGLQRARMAKVLLAKEMESRGLTKEQIAAVKTVSSGRDWLVVKGAQKEDEHQINRQAYLVVVIPGIQGYNVKK